MARTIVIKLENYPLDVSLHREISRSDLYHSYYLNFVLTRGLRLSFLLTRLQ